MILEKILYDLDVNICILSETHTLENVSPNINHFRTFRRNRIYREKGGIAVLISNDIARDCVLVWEGIGDNEAIAVQLSGTNPNVIIVANYGTQCNSFGISIPSNNLMEIQAKVTEWMEEGKIVIWAGDENVPIGVSIFLVMTLSSTAWGNASMSSSRKKISSLPTVCVRILQHIRI